MKRCIDYYFSVASPWTYLGHERFWQLAKERDLDVSFRPVDFKRVLDASGGKLYQERSEQRKQYRQVDLARWSRHLGIALTLEPAYYPVDRAPASLLMVACRELPQQSQFELLQAILASVWRDDRDIADWRMLATLLNSLGKDANTLIAQAQLAESQSLLVQHTDSAIKAGVFGVPAYVVDGELFWGQDRLEFLAHALTRKFHEAYQ